ncbi:hypothetical protein L1987_12688 [Smallanthus sonchifolius]|uniref:Uncharacterized protein n=1 Tax=Smallanthus sonchifolius TaxID=185202 RepID=A0ACB9JFE8_9ASTR|nr:hypothetical protein L1987_12688 [Smallanthus sonchifolius]
MSHLLLPFFFIIVISAESISATRFGRWTLNPPPSSAVMMALESTAPIPMIARSVKSPVGGAAAKIRRSCYVFAPTVRLAGATAKISEMVKQCNRWFGGEEKKMSKALW